MRIVVAITGATGFIGWHAARELREQGHRVRALVRDPVAFLFDEPLSNLDTKLRLEMRTELKALHKKTCATMVYVKTAAAPFVSACNYIYKTNLGK